MDQHDWDRLVEHSDDYYLGPSSNPSRKARLRTSNSTHKARSRWRKPTEDRAIRYTSESEGW